MTRWKRAALTVVTALLAAAATIGVAYAVTGQTTTAQRLSVTVTQIAGSPAVVTCRERWRDVLAPIPGPARTQMGVRPAVVEATAATCAHATSWPTTPASSWPQGAVLAAGALAHESAHVAGIRDEAQAECFALENIAELLRFDGVAVSTAVDIQQRYRDEFYFQQTGDYVGSCGSLVFGSGNPR